MESDLQAKTSAEWSNQTKNKSTRVKSKKSAEAFSHPQNWAPPLSNSDPKTTERKGTMAESSAQYKENALLE